MIKRFPTKSEVIPVFSTIVFITYSWTLIRAFWYIPSWLHFLPVLNILMVLAYIVAFTLVQSVIVLILLLFAAAILPPGWLKEKFSAQGSIIIWMISILTIVYTKGHALILAKPFKEYLLYVVLITVITIISVLFLSHFLIHRIKLLEKLTQIVSDKLVIFLYFYIPPSLVALVLVVFRNLY